MQGADGPRAVTQEARATGASFARGASEQDVGTPAVFLAAVVRRFGKLDVDLAATAANAT